MAAVVQAQLRKVEEKLKPALYNTVGSDYWAIAEKKTTLKREQLALGVLLVLGLYLAFGWGNDFLCNLIGFLFPAYASVLAVESKGTRDDTEWLIYWVVYTTATFIEYIGHSFFQTLPFYWLGKCLFLIWLMIPGPNNGSKILYERAFRPLLAKLPRPANTPAATNNLYPNANSQ